LRQVFIAITRVSAEKAFQYDLKWLYLLNWEIRD